MGSSRASTDAGRRRQPPRAAKPRSKQAAKGRAKHAARPQPSRPVAGRKRAGPAKRTSARRPRKAVPARRSAGGSRARRSPRERLRSLVRPASLAWVVLALGCLAGVYQLWLRDSALVAIDEVEVVGIDGPGRGEITAALSETARSMTTLHIDQDELEAAVAGFPTVIGVEVDAHLPDAATIIVRERPPTMIAKRGGEQLPVAADGTVLPGVEPGGARLPVVEVAELPATGQLTGGDLQLALVAGAAPPELRGLIESVGAGGDGIEVVLKGGIPVLFGSGDRAVDKWAATAAALADPKLDTLTYLDVRVPERPAAGGAAPPPAAESTETGEPEVLGQPVP